MFVQLKYRFPDTGGTAFGSLSDGAVADVCALPEDDGAASFTVTNAQWVCNDTGAGTCTFDVRLGYYDATGTFQTSATLIAEEALSNAAANDDANDTIQFDIRHGDGGNRTLGNGQGFTFGFGRLIRETWDDQDNNGSSTTTLRIVTGKQTE